MRIGLLMMVALFVGCGDYVPVEDQIKHCHKNGYRAESASVYYVHCCSWINGDDICIRPEDVTRPISERAM